MQSTLGYTGEIKNQDNWSELSRAASWDKRKLWRPTAIDSDLVWLDGISGLKDNQAPDDPVIERARDLLLRRVRWMMDKRLTPKQSKYLTLNLAGYSQTEIGILCGVNQASVYKSINGNHLYRRSTPHLNGRRHGGSIERLRKLAASDLVCRRLLAIIAAAQSPDGYCEPLSVRTIHYLG